MQGGLFSVALSVTAPNSCKCQKICRFFKS